MDATGHPPLHGLKVIDLTRHMSGPYATVSLGDFGADVIKVEPHKGGDASRSTGVRVQGTQASHDTSSTVATRAHEALANEVGVNVDETGPAVVPEFKRFFGIEYPIVYDLGAMATGGSIATSSAAGAGSGAG